MTNAELADRLEFIRSYASAHIAADDQNTMRDAIAVLRRSEPQPQLTSEHVEPAFYQPPAERQPCPLCGRTDNHTHTSGPFGMT